MEIQYIGNPNEIHSTCKLWREGRCKKSRDVCEYLHSNFCPEKDKCKREHCPLHHINQLSKKLFPLRKTGMGNAKRKKSYKQKEAGLKTNSPTSSNNGDSKSQSASPDWNLNSLAFDDFDEELCQGLEEVGQELDRFAEEVTEDSTCEDEILCLTEQKENYPSNISFKSKKPLKKEEAFKLACDQNRNNTQDVEGVETSSQARECIQGQQIEMSEGRNFIRCGKNSKWQSVASVESQNRTLIQSKEQDLHIFSDPKKLNIPGAIVGPTPSVGLDESTVIVSKSSRTLGNHSEHRDCSALADNSESVSSSIIDRQTVNINDNIMDITVSSSTTVDCIETEKSEHKSSSLSSEPNTLGEHDKRTEQMKNSDASTAQTILSSISINGYHIKEEEGRLDSSHSSSLSLEQINNTDNPTQSMFKSDSGGEKFDNEVCELNALELKKMQLVKKVKLLVTQKNNLNLQRDTVMNNFFGDTAKLAHILKENSHLSNRISNQILKFNAEIKFTNKKICDLENSRSREKPSLLKDSCMDKKETNASSHSALLSSKLETEPTVNLSNYHSLHKHETKHISKGQESHVSMQKKSTSKVKDSEIHTKPNESCSQTESRKPVMTHKRKVFQQEGDKTDVCDESLRQAQHAYSARDNSTARKNSYQENKKAIKTKGATSESSNTPRKKLCPENDKSVVLKSYMSDISKDMNTHWCKPCDVFFINVYGYVKHLESSSHLEKLKDDDCSWMEKLPNYKMKQQQEDINENQYTLGVEYLHSTKVLFCELCERLILNTEDAVLHTQSLLHFTKYKEHVLKNTDQELNFLQAKTVAFTKYLKDRSARSKSTSSDAIEGTQKESEDCAMENSVLQQSKVTQYTDKLLNSSTSKQNLVQNGKIFKKFKLA